MNFKNLLSIIVVPSLLLIISLLTYLTITNNWSYEISTYIGFVLTAFYILLFEMIIPLKEDWKINYTHYWIEIKHFLFSITLTDGLAKALVISFVLYIQDQYFESYNLLSNLPFIISFIIANIIGELLPYAFHYVSHIGKTSSLISIFLWKTHAIHHIPTTMNWFKTNWIHPINMFLNTVLKMGPLLLLGFNADIIFSVGMMHIVVAYLSHANIKTKTFLLDWIIITPQLHHFHHSKNITEAKNFGNIIPFWDIIFGTYYNRIGNVDKVGTIKSILTYPKFEDYIHQLSFPFRSKN